MGGKIYKNQDWLRIRAYTGITLSDASVILIKYKDPTGTESSWAITAIEDELNGIIYRDFPLGETLGISGLWIFWSHVTFSDGRVASGEVFQQTIYDEGS